jgi:hypothetical protein
MYWDRKSRPEFGMCSVRFIQLFLTKNIKEKTGDLTFRLEWAGFRFTQCPVSSGFTVFKKVKIFQYYLWTGSHHIVKSGKYRFSLIEHTNVSSAHIGGYCFQIHTQNYFKYFYHRPVNDLKLQDKYNTCALSKHIGKYVYLARNAGKGSAKLCLFPHF